jgi:DNA repair protein RecO (recombination protein O)
MRPHKYTLQGLILGRRNYGEADRILSVYTKDQGRVAMLAKGIRRPKSRKRGHLEIFSLVNLGVSGSHGLDLIAEAEIVNDFPGIRKSLNKVALAYYFLEVIGKITHEGEKNEELFDFILSSLKKLENKNGLKDQREFFIKNLLTILGYWPEGKVMDEPDKILEEVVERQLGSARVGKRMLE